MLFSARQHLAISKYLRSKAEMTRDLVLKVRLLQKARSSLALARLSLVHGPQSLLARVRRSELSGAPASRPWPPAI